ncbi:helix-turn-helix domain-containing protein [Streptomyces sp. G44]|uniref:helix-turn-helix domain-containing protein n=1 Tax=Streptomyces sp. G44 TaxID=2807632 RepID=UPI00195FC999|nr:helix-turn-helix domain-containing protein [Streptomyces sp. G44]MBM7167709.1 helix-turn-helix domain-containing protein [Streptomyces sp. G44]
MPRLPAIPPDAKARIVMDLLSGRVKLSAAADQAGVSVQTICIWRRQFIDAGHRGLQPTDRQSWAARRERELLTEIKGLKAALGEAHLALRNSRRGQLSLR